MKRIIFFVLITTLYGCDVALTDIESVKGGILSDYPQTTVGAALDNWQECSASGWESAELDNGTKLVNFNCEINVQEYAKNYQNPILGYLGTCLTKLQYWGFITLEDVAEQYFGGGFCDGVDAEKIQLVSSSPSPILEIQFILNLDDTFSQNSISLLNSVGEVIVDPFLSDLILDVVYSDDQFNDDTYELLVYLVASSL